MQIKRAGIHFFRQEIIASRVVGERNVRLQLRAFTVAGAQAISLYFSWSNSAHCIENLVQCFALCDKNILLGEATAKDTLRKVDCKLSALFFY